MTKSEWWPISKLKLWDKNPRSIKGPRFEELKRRLKRQGQVKPLLITEDGTVIGGNMRLRAMQALNIDEAWVSVTDAKTDKDIFDLALTDNEEFGFYDKDALAELAYSVGLDKSELSRYELNLGKPTTLELVAARHNETPELKPEVEFSEELLEHHNYVVLYFENSVDWLQLQSVYPLDSVKTKDNLDRLGTGRVINGAKFLEAVIGEN